MGTKCKNNTCNAVSDGITMSCGIQCKLVRTVKVVPSCQLQNGIIL